ncbi:MAG: L-threonylcarbamoyladenylate synthase [Candidatus Limnocylindrales bacterium]
MTARVLRDDSTGRAEAIHALRRGGLVGLPTDTVYGLAVALDAPDAIERLFAAKARPPDKAIVLLVADIGQAERTGVFGHAARSLAAALWPGALTLVVPRRPEVRLPEILTAGGSTIGLRLPGHGTPRALARALGPLPVTSANRSGEPDLTNAAGLEIEFSDELEVILDGGPAPGGISSTVVRCDGWDTEVLRVGAIQPARIAEVVKAARKGHPIAAPAPAVPPDEWDGG